MRRQRWQKKREAKLLVRGEDSDSGSDSEAESDVMAGEPIAVLLSSGQNQDQIEALPIPQEMTEE